MQVKEFQERIERIYLARDTKRGLAGTHMWFCEEVGELTRALRRNNKAELEGEFADVFAWLVSLASMSGVSLEQAIEKKYAKGCPRCAASPCSCA